MTTFPRSRWIAAAVGLGLGSLGLATAEANGTAQPLPFSQSWTNTGLITASDDWSGVPGIIGYLGDFSAASTADVDPRTLTADFSGTAVDVIANQANPNTVSAGGVGEFETADPSVALQGSGTADAPFLLLHLNTTGSSNISVGLRLRDLDSNADNAVQQVAVQYRVGSTGTYTNVTGGYVADATTGPNINGPDIPLNLTLPAAADNQPLVFVRVLTTNATGFDEWVGIDDITVAGTPAPVIPEVALVAALPLAGLALLAAIALRRRRSMTLA